MTGEVERHGFIAKLPIRHLLAVLVLGVNEAREQIVAGLLPGAARLDEAVQHVVQVGDGLLQLQVPRRRHPKRHANQRAELRTEHEERSSQSLHERLAVLVVVEPEQRLERDRTGEAAELEVDVDAFAGLPVVDHLAGEFAHHRCVGMHAAFEERGLRELALPEPEITFAGNEPFAQHGHVHAGTEVLDVELGVREQDLLDEVRMAGEEDATRPETKAREIAVGASDLAEEIEPLRHEGLEAPTDERAFGAGRQPGVRDGVHGKPTCPSDPANIP